MHFKIFPDASTVAQKKSNRLTNIFKYRHRPVYEPLRGFFKVHLNHHLREGGTLLVWKLDRRARSLINFTNIANLLKEKGVAFKSITEPFLDTTSASPHGKFLVNIFASLAEFERDIIIECTKAGLESAQRKGKVLGPPRGLSKKAEQKAILAEDYFRKGELTVDEILEKLNISRGTYYKYLRHRGVKSIRTYKKM